MHFQALTLVALATVAVAAPQRLPSHSKRTVSGPVINQDFADPALILPNGSGSWYSYSTSSSHGNVPYATSANFGTWTVHGDALPDSGSWVDSGNSGIWAPDVRQVGGGYVMYYTGFSASEINHCIGVATSSVPQGPFTPQANPLICDSGSGGVIDASGFQDVGGARYVLWKVDGNSQGKSTPIMIQPVGSDGYTLQGSATQLITNGQYDGGVTEAPSLVYWNGFYYLFFSSNNYNTLYYDVSYATSKSVTGPFTKSTKPLLLSGDCGTAGPGGATVINVNNNYVNAVFHSDINGKDASGGRAMWEIPSLSLSNGVASMSC
ncbi:hypothetical protein RQP46_009783 [Phenoliferia psychrophenolica]